MLTVVSSSLCQSDGWTVSSGVDSTLHFSYKLDLKVSLCAWQPVWTPALCGELAGWSKLAHQHLFEPPSLCGASQEINVNSSPRTCMLRGFIHSGSWRPWDGPLSPPPHSKVLWAKRELITPSILNLFISVLLLEYEYSFLLSWFKSPHKSRTEVYFK